MPSQLSAPPGAHKRLHPVHSLRSGRVHRTVGQRDSVIHDFSQTEEWASSNAASPLWNRHLRMPTPLRIRIRELLRLDTEHRRAGPGRRPRDTGKGISSFPAARRFGIRASPHGGRAGYGPDLSPNRFANPRRVGLSALHPSPPDALTVIAGWIPSLSQYHPQTPHPSLSPPQPTTHFPPIPSQQPPMQRAKRRPRNRRTLP